jgi:hypothetical protein
MTQLCLDRSVSFLSEWEPHHNCQEQLFRDFEGTALPHMIYEDIADSTPRMFNH